MDPDDEVSTVGWDSINAALERVYPGQEPRHWGTLLSFRIGGEDPLDGISAYLHDGAQTPPHWHYVSYGLSELYSKENDNKKLSGWGFEFTFRLKREVGESEPPQWPLSLLQNLARYVFNTGNVFAPGDYLPLNGPILLGRITAIHAAMFIEDPELGRIETPNGALQFLQLVGATVDELAAARGWDTTKFLEVMQRTNLLLLTDLDRTSILSSPDIAREVQDATARDGSSSAWLMVRELEVIDNTPPAERGIHTVVVGARGIKDIQTLLVGRVPFGRSFQIVGPSASVEFVPAAKFGWRKTKEGNWTVDLTSDMAGSIAAALVPKRGDYAVPGLPELLFRVVPTHILDATGKHITEVIG